MVGTLQRLTSKGYAVRKVISARRSEPRDMLGRPGHGSGTGRNAASPPVELRTGATRAAEGVTT
jgi:hypothetical protein